MKEIRKGVFFRKGRDGAKDRIVDMRMPDGKPRKVILDGYFPKKVMSGVMDARYEFADGTVLVGTLTEDEDGLFYHFSDVTLRIPGLDMTLDARAHRLFSSTSEINISVLLFGGYSFTKSFGTFDGWELDDLTATHNGVSNSVRFDAPVPIAFAMSVLAVRYGTIVPVAPDVMAAIVRSHSFREYEDRISEQIADMVTKLDVMTEQEAETRCTIDQFMEKLHATHGATIASISNEVRHVRKVYAAMRQRSEAVTKEVRDMSGILRRMKDIQREKQAELDAESERLSAVRKNKFEDMMADVRAEMVKLNEERDRLFFDVDAARREIESGYEELRQKRSNKIRQSLDHIRASVAASVQERDTINHEIREKVKKVSDLDCQISERVGHLMRLCRYVVKVDDKYAEEGAPTVGPGIPKCAICYERHVGSTLPCGHTFCSECAGPIRKCPFCRKQVLYPVVKLFF